MARALKEEYVPPWWIKWRETEPSHRLRGAASINVPVDIIAVQGLASTYESTWTKDVGNGQSVMWLRDLLKTDLPNARIMSFEYDSKWLNDPAMISLEDCGERLLESVIWDRTHKGSREHRQMCPIMARRPLILIGHSYGGLVIKQALVTAATAPTDHPRYDDYQAFITAISGVMFLGTPHSGSSFASAGIFQANFRSWFGSATNTEILKPLALDTTMTTLEDLETDFRTVLSEDRLSALILLYFYETKPLTVGPFQTKLVVQKESACYGSHKSLQIPLDANHMEMNKFGSHYESNYQRVIQELIEMHRTASNIVNSRWGRYQYDTHYPGGAVKEIKHWLSPEDVFNDDYITRRDDRLEGTCEWAYKVDVIADWLHSSPDSRTKRSEPKPPVLVAGKAGSGKSVLAAYLHHNLAERLRIENWSADDASRCSGFGGTLDCQDYTVTDNKAVLYFPVSTSSKPASIIRTLIDQLLHFQPTNSGLQNIVQSKLNQRNVKECTSDVGIDILIRLLQTYPSVHIIIDGLDECDKPGEIISLLKGVRRIEAVNLLLLSRHDHELDMLISRQDQAILSDSNGYFPEFKKLDIVLYNANDIDNFIEEELSTLAKSNSYICEERNAIQQLISKDAQGMFQWVKLILYELNFVQSKDDVFRFLHRFPRALNDAYSTTFKRLSRNEGFDKDDTILVLKLLLAAYRSLKWLDLAVAFQLHCELRKYPRLNLQSLEEIVNVAIRKAHDLPDSYFSFLGPLVDIRTTGEAVGTIGWQSFTNNRKSTTVVICHHSLTQWIEGTASAVKKNSEWWQEFQFSRIDAHKPLALLCLTMMSSASKLGDYLQDIYFPERSNSPFLTYAGEYWSFHLRAVGGWSTTDHQRDAQYRDGVTRDLVLADFATIALYQSIDVATGVCLALSTTIRTVNVQKVSSLPKVIALRSLQTAILPATRALGQLKGLLPDILTTLREVQSDMGLANSSYPYGALFDTATTTIGLNLDSESVSRVLATLRTLNSPTSIPRWRQQRKWKTHIRILCQASRALRQLSILLAVDPVRAWIYSRTGDSGVSPLVALSHTSEAIDTYLAASLLLPELFTRYDLRDQFNADHSHPQYGLIIATRRELSIRNDSSLDSAFYKEYIMNHYRISGLEWSTIRLMIASLEMHPKNPFGMDIAIKYWLASHALRPQTSSQDQWEPAIQFMSRIPSQSVRRSVRKTKELISTLLRGGAVFGFKYLTHLVPSLEQVFVSAVMFWGLTLDSLKPTIKLLADNRKDFAFAFVLYCLRCRYAPWLFATAQNVHWNSIWGPIYDIQGVVADPKGYVPPFTPFTWPWLAFFYYFAQEMMIWGLSVFDVLATQMPEGTSMDIFPESLLRRTSFRLDWTNGDPHQNLAKLRKAFISHGFAIFVAIRRLLFVERIVSLLIVWIYELIKAAVAMAHLSPWRGESMLMYGVQLGSFAYGRSNIVGGIKLLFRIYIWSWLYSWYQPSSLFGLVYHYAYLPANSICIRASAHYSERLMTRLTSTLQSIDDYETRAIQAVNGLDIRTLVFALAGAICAAGLLFWYIMSDPLNLGSAARSCEKAEELAKKVTSIEDPIAFLKWRANGTETQDAIAFTQLLIDLDRED